MNPYFQIAIDNLTPEQLREAAAMLESKRAPKPMSNERKRINQYKSDILRGWSRS